MSRREEAEVIMRKHVGWSIGAGLVPIPGLDIAAVTLIQLDMLKQLCRVYEINYSESSGKSLVSAVTGSTLARIGASMIKAIPGLGTVLGGISMPVLSGASTYAIAQAVIMHFESEGDLIDIDFETIKNVYKDQLQKGKEFASKMYEKGKAAQSTSSDDEDVVEELEKLLQLREQGIITEEEFESQKEKLLEQI